MTEPQTNNRPTDFAIVARAITVNRPIDETWRVIGAFADAGRFLNVSSKLVSGIGQIGSVRAVAEAIYEVMVGSSTYSYTYAQVRGPMAEFLYHGCVELSVLDSASCTLSYTLIYDQSGMDETRRAIEFERVSLRFQNAAEAMKVAAETTRD